MSKRLQVLLDEDELRELQELARREGLPASEWVRRALRDARRREARGDLDSKLRAAKKAAAHSFPTADIDAMLAEIELGNGAPAAE